MGNQWFGENCAKSIANALELQQSCGNPSEFPSQLSWFILWCFYSAGEETTPKAKKPKKSPKKAAKSAATVDNRGTGSSYKSKEFISDSESDKDSDDSDAPLKKKKEVSILSEPRHLGVLFNANFFNVLNRVVPYLAYAMPAKIPKLPANFETVSRTWKPFYYRLLIYGSTI